MQRDSERNLDILTAIGESGDLTQRALAQRLGVALGLANLYLKRLATKGYIKVTEFHARPAARKRLRFLLTPTGIAEKTRLTYEHATYSLNLYRRTRQTLRQSLGGAATHGMKRVALYGTGDAAELAYLTLKEAGIEPVGVYADGGGRFLGFPVQPVSELVLAEVDGIVVATFDRPEGPLQKLRRLGVPGDKCLTLRRVLGPADGAAADDNATVGGRS
jgi:DNA-binding MarR family transcriptional regulator